MKKGLLTIICYMAFSINGADSLQYGDEISRWVLDPSTIDFSFLDDSKTFEELARLVGHGPTAPATSVINSQPKQATCIEALKRNSFFTKISCG